MFFVNKLRSIVFLIALLVIASYIFTLFSKPIDSKDRIAVTPTLFIHGFKGGPGSFNNMLERFERNNWGSRNLSYRVSSGGQLSIKGEIGNEPHPLIQVIYENNRATILHQTIWLQKVMTNLHQVYGIEQVNLVGHSMGGLTAANFLVNNQDGSYPTVEKLVVIASPFKGIDDEEYFEKNYGAATTDLKVGSHALRHFFDRKDYFGSNIEVLAIAGVINDSNSDGLVSLSSALGIRENVQFNNLNEKVFYDASATHSGLHEHKGVDKLVASFLWNYKMY